MLPLEITPESVKALLDRGETFTLLDVREPWEWQTVHISGAQHIPMNSVPGAIPTELQPGQTVVVYCHHGVRSLTVAQWLRGQGFDNAQSMAGGIDAWARQIDNSLPLY